MAQTVAFDSPASEVGPRIAAQCMERGHTVIELTQNQVKCEIALNHTERAQALFLNFRQRRYTDQVRQFVGFTVVPNGEGSLVQTRAWVEAIIGGETRSRDVDADVPAALVELGGVRR
jgi:hypothetical protein